LPQAQLFELLLLLQQQPHHLLMVLQLQVQPTS
jgi:hypothetical protein